MQTTETRFPELTQTLSQFVKQLATPQLTMTAANCMHNKKAVLPQGNRAMPQVFFSVEVRQQHSLQV